MCIPQIKCTTHNIHKANKFIEGRKFCSFSLSLVCQAWSDRLSPRDGIASKGGHPCHYCSFGELENAPFHLSSYLGGLDYAQNVPLRCILGPSSEEGQGLAVACDQGVELDLCDPKDDYVVVVVAPQTVPHVQGEAVGDVEFEGAAVVLLACSFLDQLG